METDANDNSSILIGEVQLILAEKRTSLSTMRLGIAVLALPLTVLSFLIVTSKHYNLLHVMYLMIPLTLLVLVLAIFGFYLVIKSIRHMHHYDKIIHKIKKRNGFISELLD